MACKGKGKKEAKAVLRKVKAVTEASSREDTKWNLILAAG